LFPLFATGVIDTGGKFAAGVVDTGGKLPPVSTTQGKMVAKFATGVVDTGGKFAAGVVETGGNLLPVSLKDFTCFQNNCKRVRQWPLQP
jgi:hypothetical protein